MSYSYERIDTQRQRRYGASSSRSTLGYWVPLAVTVTVATIGLAAWIWKERGEEEEFEYRRDDRRDTRKDTSQPPPEYGAAAPGEPPFPPETQAIPPDDPGLIARMQGMVRRTPSPQQLIDQAGRRISAGAVAAGTAVAGAVGGALSSIREEDKAAYEDHTRWSEEAATSRMVSSYTAGAPQLPASARGDRRKAVAIVVSAEVPHNPDGSEDPSYFQEHASILSHLPEHIDDDCRVFIMIYAPDLKQHPLAVDHSSRPGISLSSSYSNIGQEDLQAQSPGSQIVGDISRPSDSGSRMFKALYAQAEALVEKKTMIMPFTTPGGYVHLLRHIAPEVVYVQATIAGDRGEAVKHIAGWVGQVVLVVGDDSGHGGLVDSEDEHGGARSDTRWWQDDPKIGLGKGIEVVEGMRMGEDWRRRVRGHD